MGSNILQRLKTLFYGPLLVNLFSGLNLKSPAVSSVEFLTTEILDLFSNDK